MLIAVVVVVVVREFVPFGSMVLYPFTLFGTWVHEMGHGVTGLLVGGTFDRLEIFFDASGLAYGSVPAGWPSALRSAGGLLGPPLVGASVLAIARGPRRATAALYGLGLLMALSVPLWVRSAAGLVAIPLLALTLCAAAYKLGPAMRHLTAQALGVLLAVDTLTRIDYLFTERAVVGGEERLSDVARIGEAVGGPWWMWGAGLAAVSVVLLAIGVRLAWAAPLELPRLRRREPRDDDG